MESSIRAGADRKPKERSKTRIEDAYRQIKQLIFDQKLIPGQKLIYDDLAAMLNMSRTPVINALNRLEQQGLVVSESHRGFYVRPMDLQEAWDAFGVREAIEIYAVEQAIIKADESDFKKLEKRLAECDAYNQHYDRKKIFLDAAFHIQIADMTRNKLLKWHLKVNMEHIYLRAKLDNYDIERMEAASQEHHLLLRKMKNKDVKGSVEIIRRHIEAARSAVIACLSEESLKFAGFGT